MKLTAKRNLRTSVVSCFSFLEKSMASYTEYLDRVRHCSRLN